MTEQELCNIVKKSGLFPGFRLHEEVGISSVSCDMVYENGNDVYTIEAKTELNFKLLEQALRWQYVATASFIAVPTACGKDWWNNPKRTVVKQLGLGVIFVFDDSARFAPGSIPFLRDSYDDCGNKDFYTFPADMDYWRSAFSGVDGRHVDAGSKNGNRSTPFSRTVAALKIEAEKHPDYSLDQLLTIVPTHYSSVKSARGAIKKYAETGVIKKFWR